MNLQFFLNIFFKTLPQFLVADEADAVNSVVWVPQHPFTNGLLFTVPTFPFWPLPAQEVPMKTCDLDLRAPLRQASLDLSWCWGGDGCSFHWTQIWKVGGLETTQGGCQWHCSQGNASEKWRKKSISEEIVWALHLVMPAFGQFCFWANKSHKFESRQLFAAHPNTWTFHN